MKLDTSKIKDNVAVHCPKIEYVRFLFEAWGFNENNITRAEKHWGLSEYTRYFEKYKNTWEHGDLNYYVQKSTK